MTITINNSYDMSNHPTQPYDVVKVLHKSRHSAVFRAKYNEEMVIIKTHPNKFASTKEAESLKKEFQIGKKICANSNHVPKYLQLLENSFDNNVTVAFVMEDRGGENLSHSIPPKGFPIPNFLDVAIQCSLALQTIHRNNITHKDIKPSNIQVCEEGDIIIYDFGCATSLQEESEQASAKLNKMYGTLAYLSPEQTGRINRNTDFRTDFYSLIISNTLPFVSSDVLELIHCHLAVAPPPLPTSVPPVIQSIIYKLMKKDAADRYQSCQGVIHDLQLCKSYLKWDETLGVYTIKNFTLGNNDFQERFVIPKKLYGRKENFEKLDLAYKRVLHQGSTELVLVSGYSGVGKSTFVREIQMQNLGYFTFGKFDQLDKGVAYSAIGQSISHLLKQLEAQSEDVIALWVQRLLGTLNGYGQLLLPFVPNLEQFIGPQPHIQNLTPTESKSRLKHLITKFIIEFTSKTSPLVLFLDDIQWADLESLDVLKSFLSERHVLLICAYRDNEVHPGHCTYNFIQDVCESMKVTEIHLNPLLLEHVTEWTCDTLRITDPKLVLDLSNLLFAKTNGNPFFMKMFLQNLHSEGLLVAVGKQWTWDMDRVSSMSATDNVVDLMTSRITKLRGKSKKCIQYASCLGNRFSCKHLSIILDQSDQSTREDLYESMDNGLLIRISNEYQFVHDKVQEAAYGTLSQQEKAEMHFLIGTKMSEWCESDSRLFCETTDHLNKGISTIRGDDNEQIWTFIAKSNFKACKIAEKAASFSTCLKYCLSGIDAFESIGPNPWETHYEIGLELYLQCGFSHLILGEIDKSSVVFDLLLQHTKRIQDTARVYLYKVQQRGLCSDILGAVEIGCYAVSHLFNINLPQEKEEIQKMLDLEMDKVISLVSAMSLKDSQLVVDHLLDREHDAEQKALIQLLSETTTTAYQANPLLFRLIDVLAVNTMFEFGLDASSSSCSIGWLAVSLFSMSAHLGDCKVFRIAKLLSMLSLKCCLDYFPHNVPERTRSHHLFALFHSCWMNPIEQVFSVAAKVVAWGLESGELLYAMYSYVTSCPAMLYTGKNIQKSLEYIDRCKLVAQKYNNQVSIHCIDSMSIIFMYLTKDARAPQEESRLVSLLLSSSDMYVYTQFNVLKVMVNYLLSDDLILDAEQVGIQLNEQFDHLDDLLQFVTSQFSTAYYALFCCLHCLRVIKQIDNHDSPVYIQLLNRLNVNKAKLLGWSQNCESNFKNKYLMVEAQVQAYIEQKGYAALQLFEEAISASQHFPHEQAICYQLEAYFLLSMNNQKFAKASISCAYQLFSEWGAHAKCEQLDDRFGPFMITPQDNGNNSIRSQSSSNSHTLLTTSTIVMPNASFDIESVLRTSQLISSTIDMDDLLCNSIKIIMEAAGATSATIVLDDIVVATHQNDVTSLPNIPISEWNQHLLLIEHVKMTRNSVVSLNCEMDNRPFIAHKNECRSLLCMPIIHQSILKGVLLAQNNYLSNSFKPDCVGVISVLINQIAISLENSKFYISQMKNMEELTRVQTRRVQEELNYTRKQEEFIDRICHEIRNPIQGILGNCEWMTTLLQEERPNIDILRECINSISVCGKYQKVITDDVITLSKLEFGKIKLVNTQTTASQIMDDLSVMFANEARLKKLTWKCECDSECVDKVVEVDANKVIEVMTNLITNAIKFTSHGTIQISCNLTELSTQSVRLQFQVKDTGCGIEESELETIFDRFSQATQRTFSDYGGSGLGLFISKMYANLMEGTISVQSKKWSGSTFSFSIKCNVVRAEPSAAVPTAEVITPVEVPKLKVLVVEDNKINQRVLVRMLQSCNCEYVIANDGVEGLEKFSEQEFDLIYMDVAMPRMDGFECTRKIRQMEQSTGVDRGVLIVGLSGNARQEHVDMSKEAGMDLYQIKPCSSKDVNHVIENYKTLSRRRSS
ncbi:hypothetical protein AKO1_007934 [Acrasis kona]|uniref:Uncharacterized protein n=1 Tax=Acrasis kona TaxID=1008807 RepID=A0AAW2YPG0_9EUKA